MSILAIRDNLTWPYPSKDLKVMQQRIPEMQEKLFFDWAYEETGPRLRGEILVHMLSDQIVNDMQALRELGCSGYVVFAQSHSEYPIIKCTIEPDGITWWAQKHIQTPVHYDPIERRKYEEPTKAPASRPSRGTS